MDHVADRSRSGSDTVPQVRQVDAARVFVWLRRGLDDLSMAWRVSLSYGALVAAFGAGLLVVAWQSAHLVPTLVGGFLLVAPFAALVLCALSRQIEEGAPIDSVAAAFAWRSNSGQIALYALVLAICLIAWERLAAITFALSWNGEVPDPQLHWTQALFTVQSMQWLAAFIGVGALVAAAVFTLSVVTMQVLLDRPVDVVTAMLTSLRCCWTNPAATALWAVMIAALMALGFATAMIGLVLIFPWLGHATWHAYRDMVEPEG